MFGALQLYHVMTHHTTFMYEVYNLSKQPDKAFPVAVASLHVSLHALDVVMSGKLDWLCIDKEFVMEAMTDYYLAVFFEFYKRWEKGNFTENEFHMIFDVNVLPYAKKQQKRIIKNYLRHVTAKRNSKDIKSKRKLSKTELSALRKSEGGQKTTPTDHKTSSGLKPTTDKKAKLA